MCAHCPTSGPNPVSGSFPPAHDLFIKFLIFIGMNKNKNNNLK